MQYSCSKAHFLNQGTRSNHFFSVDPLMGSNKVYHMEIEKRSKANPDYDILNS